jgi:hypothetical protein
MNGFESLVARIDATDVRGMAELARRSIRS